MSLFDKSYQEKRDFMRMKIEAPLSAELYRDGEQLTGMCRELSGGGMQVELTNPLVEGEEVEVKLASTHGHSPQLHARAKVVRVQPENSGYLAGLEILEIFD